MRDEAYAPKWRQDPLYRQILLDGCRNALRNGNLTAWLRTRRDEVGDLVAAARDADPAMHVELCRAPEPRKLLRILTTRAWTSGDPAALSMTVELIILSSARGLTVQRSNEVEKLLDRLDPKARATAYRVLVVRLREHYRQTADAESDNAGWVYLLACAAGAVNAARCPDEAVLLYDEAWANRHRLPPGTVETARAKAHVASSYAFVVGWLQPSDGPISDLLSEAVRRIASARDELDPHVDALTAFRSRLTLDIAESNVWFWRSGRGLVGSVTSAEKRVALLTAAEAYLWRQLPLIDQTVVVDDYGTVPAGVRAQVARLLRDLGSSAEFTGEPELAERAARACLELTDLPHHQVDARLTLARTHPRLDERLRRNEELLRELQNGLDERLGEWQGNRVVGLLATEWRRLGTALFREKKKVAGWFWKRQADELASPKSPEPSAAQPAAAQVRARPSHQVVGAAEIPAAHEPPDPARAWLTGITESVTTENPLRVIVALREGVEKDFPAEILLKAMAMVDQWRPRQRRRDPLRPRPSVGAAPEELRLAALRLASEFLGYAVYLGPQVYMKMAAISAQPERHRVDWARRAAAYAERAGRSHYSVSAWETILELGLAQGAESLVSESVREIQDVVRAAFSDANGAADLIDVAEEMIRRTVRAAGSLAAHGHAEAAFGLASSATGAVRRMIEADPAVAEELELVEQRADARDGDVEDRLFAAMRKRVLTDRDGAQASSQPQPGAVTGSVVQLVDAGVNGCWALGHSGQRYWAERLDIDRQGLTELRESVWHHLRPSRRHSPLPILKELHRVVVAPMQRHLGSDVVTFVLHGGFAGLPLHAATDGDHHLIERCPVTYVADPSDDTTANRCLGEALVAGWDPEIDGGDEASEISEHLTTFGFSVVRPPRAKDGRKALLNGDSTWGVVHLVAHGDFYAWPLSMRSRLRLSMRVAISAGEWLQSSCRSSFVFINACNVGRHAPHAGDLNGFPLAIQVRGAVASVSALAPVPTEPARRFARRFYEHWPSGDSFSAFRQACVDAIRTGEPVCGWAPYLHSGARVVIV